ncbi:MAG: ArsR/SmtB family transcription factor [Promethearchaeota archaeon]
MEQIMVLREAKVLKALLNKWRSKILQFLIIQEHTVQQLANMLGINPGTVYHHVKVLQDTGLVDESRTEIERNIVARYYRAVAREFRVDFSNITGKKDKDVTEWVRSRLEGLIDALKAYNIDIPKENYSDIKEQITSFQSFQNKLKEEIKPKNPKLLENMDSSIIADIFSLMELYYLNQNKQYVKLREELLNFLKKYEMA